jgi:hypothetical protein
MVNPNFKVSNYSTRRVRANLTPALGLGRPLRLPFCPVSIVTGHVNVPCYFVDGRRHRPKVGSPAGQFIKLSF